MSGSEDDMTTPAGPPPPKKDVATALLEGSSLFVHLDPRKADVIVPPYFKKQPQLVLQVGLNMPVPILDLALDDDSMTCTLSFNRSPFWCRIPWASVYALVGEDGKGMVWPDEVPKEIVARMEHQSRAPADRQPSVAKKRPRPRAAARAPAPAADSAASARPNAKPAASGGKRSAPKGKRELPPYLRVVK
jgi:stringent starvation protein B